MKFTTTLFSALFLGLIVHAQTPCVGGFAGPYPCNGYDLMSHIDLNTMNAGGGNSGWGWTDPDTGKEYGLMCLDNGTAFIDISDPVNPVYLGKVPTHTGNALWRDVRVYNNYAFIVSDGNGAHGMQVFDLTRLRNVANPPQTFSTDAHYNGFTNCHTIVIDEDNGYAYGVGTNTHSGGAHIVNIQDPLNPVFAGGYADQGYTHEAMVITYTGPDPDHQGKQLYIGSNVYQIVILDVTNKNNIQLISTISYNNVAYTHQGWLTEDQRYFLLGDELDEVDFGFNSKTLVFDFTDLDNPVHKFDHFGPTGAIDHNGYVVGDKYYLANYTAGLRVKDISDIDNNTMTEIGYFDSYPQNNNTSFNGVWNVYPFFESGNIMLTDMNGGFFLVRDPNHASVQEQAASVYSLFPNPADQYLTIKSKNAPINSLQVFNTLGQELMAFENGGFTNRTIDVSSLSKGIYLLVVNGNISEKFIKK